MADSPTTTLQLKLISCKDMKFFNFFQKISLYALISIESRKSKDKIRNNHPLLQPHRTPTDKQGGGNPEWNQEISFDLTEMESSTSSINSDNEDKQWFLRFDLLHEGGMFGDKNIGKVLVPLKDLINHSNDAAQFVSYQIRTADGKPNGVLSFSSKFNSKNKMSMEEEIGGKVQYPKLDSHESHQSQQLLWEYPSAQEPPRAYPPPTAENTSCAYPRLAERESLRAYPPPPQEPPRVYPPQPPLPPLILPPPPPIMAPPHPYSAVPRGNYYHYPYPPDSPGKRPEDMWAPPDPSRFGGGSDNHHYWGRVEESASPWNHQR